MGPLEAKGSGGVLGGGRRLLRGLEVLAAPGWGGDRCDSAVLWCGQGGGGNRGRVGAARPPPGRAPLFPGLCRGQATVTRIACGHVPFR